MYRNLLGPTTCNSAGTNASAGSASGAGSDDRDASSCSGGRDGVLAYLAALSPPLDLVVCDSITAPGFHLAQKLGVRAVVHHILPLNLLPGLHTPSHLPRAYLGLEAAECRHSAGSCALPSL